MVILARSVSEEFSSGSDSRKDADEYPSPKDKDKDEGELKLELKLKLKLKKSKKLKMQGKLNGWSKCTLAECTFDVLSS